MKVIAQIMLVFLGLSVYNIKAFNASAETNLRDSKAASSQSNTSPNIIVILVDDAGYVDFGFQGSTIAITPNIDTLAADGTIFTQGYVTDGLCAPSRAGILSGQYQNKLGFGYNIASGVDVNSVAPDHNFSDLGLDPNVPTMGNFLQDLGYETSIFGKWHLGLGEQSQHHPNNRGFDFFYGLLGGSRAYDQIATQSDKKLQRNGVIVEPTTNDFFVTDLITDEALSYMAQQISLNNPFLTFMSYTAPHGPYTAKPADYALFENIPGLTENDKNYYGLLKNLDDNVKRITDFLKQENEYDNTLFVFLSDNGGVISKAGDNGVLRGEKGSTYEGGIRVPFFVTWNNTLPSGNTYNDQVISLDLTTTFIKVAGGNLNDNEYFDLGGEDLIDAINTGTPIHNKLYWSKGVGGGAVSDGTNKVRFTQGANFSTDMPPQMYDLDNDISETTNIYSGSSSTAQSLITDFNNWKSTLDLPSWIPGGVVEDVCGPGVPINSCTFLNTYYANFASNTLLTEAANTQLPISQTSTTISQVYLEYTDSIKSPNEISFTINQLPQYGTINKSGQPLGIGDSFKQIDINSDIQPPVLQLG